MIRALTGFSTRNPWKVIALWAVLGIFLTALSQALIYRVTQTQSGDFLPAKYDSAAALRIAEKRFGVKPDANAVTVLVARADGAPLTEDDHRRVGAVAERLGRQRVQMPAPKEDTPSFLIEDHSQTPAVSPAMVAPDRGFELLSVQLTGNSGDPGLHDLYRAFRDRAKEEFAGAGMRTGFTGGLADVADTAEAEKTTQTVVGILMVGLIVLINILVFRSVLAAFVPLLAVVIVGGAAAGAVVGAAKLTGIKLDASTPSMISVVLIGIGVDYFLFLLFRFREQLRAHPDVPARAVAADVSARVGTAITSAALTIVAAFATLGTATFGQFRVLGPAIAVSVLVMLLASQTLMPALLAVTGRKMFWPSRALKREPRPGTAARIGDLVARRPFTLVLASVALLGALAAGLIGIRMDFGQGAGTHDTPAAATSAEISRALPAGVSDPATVYVTAKNGRALTAAELGDLPKALAGVKGVGQVGSTTFNGDLTAARIDLYLTADAQSQRARDLVSGPVRDTVARHTPAGLEAHVGGTAAIFADISTAVDHDLRIVFPVAAVLIALILLVLLRSLLAPAVLMAAVGLGFAATLGASALFFQHLLDKPGVNFVLPLVLFLFVVALGTDYNILISDRIREEMERPGPARAAVARAVRHTAPAIATAGIVLAASFGSLAVNAAPSTQQIGFATALGILLSAFVLSIVLVPALAAILGRGTWWPVRPGRHHGRHHAGPTAPEPHHDRVSVH
ncbi:MMPL family transporter [Streptomyces griseocarneus]|uniref:MMPL family transporter n=1 Tax=Streptomyces griseocarneus TaxID=51201 RepID=UPI00167D1FC1|nr:MMPL family transporter [Streptomyces griseocarneus]MBZ6475149.1 MMPL family transporter [Streptomyces griseocarneus]GHG61986.1 putative membrane protein [Streptomyces griseocarneus]